MLPRESMVFKTGKTAQKHPGLLYTALGEAMDRTWSITDISTNGIGMSAGFEGGLFHVSWDWQDPSNGLSYNLRESLVKAICHRGLGSVAREMER